MWGNIPLRDGLGQQPIRDNTRHSQLVSSKRLTAILPAALERIYYKLAAYMLHRPGVTSGDSGDLSPLTFDRRTMRRNLPKLLSALIS